MMEQPKPLSDEELQSAFSWAEVSRMGLSIDSAKRLLSTIEARDREIAEAEKAYDGVCQSLTDAFAKRDSAEALIVRLGEGLKPFAEAEKRWMDGGQAQEIRMDWMTAARELLSSPEVLAVMEKRK